MSNLPTLDTNNISWIAFYDVTEHTNLTQIKTEDLTTDINEIKQVTAYDNGVVLEYQTANRIAYIRASDDGKLSAYFDTTENYIQYNTDGAKYKDNTDKLKGIHDIVDWGSGTEQNLTENELEKAIRNCLESLSSWSSDIQSNYNSEDVELYNYQYESSNASIFSVNTGSDNDYYLQYTDETIIKKIVFTVRSKITNDKNNYVTFKDMDIGYPSNSNTYSSVDITNQVKSNEEIKISLNTQYYTKITLHVIVIWE